MSSLSSRPKRKLKPNTRYLERDKPSKSTKNFKLHTEVPHCYICDEDALETSYNLTRCKTLYTKTSYAQCISQLCGSNFVVVVSESDVACQCCSALLTRRDKLIQDLNIINKTLTTFLERKYSIVFSNESVPPNAPKPASNKKRSNSSKCKTAKIPTSSGLNRRSKTSHILDDEDSCRDINFSCGNFEDCQSIVTQKPGVLEVDYTDENCKNMDIPTLQEKAVLYKCNQCFYTTTILSEVSNHDCVKTKNRGTQELKSKASCKNSASTIDSSKCSFSHPKIIVGLICDHCNFIGNNKSNLKRHMMRVHLNKWICIYCKSEFKNEVEFALHCKFHLPSTSTTVKCDICLKVFNSSIELEKHLKCHLLYQCGSCQKIYSSNKDFASHVDYTKSILSNYCNICCVLLPSEDTFKNHLVSNHNGKNEVTDETSMKGMYVCTCCRAEFDSVEIFGQHKQSHLKKRLILLESLGLKINKDQIKKSSSFRSPGETLNISNIETSDYILTTQENSLKNLITPGTSISSRKSMKKKPVIIASPTVEMNEYDNDEPDSEILFSPDGEKKSTEDLSTVVTNINEEEIEKGPHKCEICYKRVDSLDDLQEHINGHVQWDTNSGVDDLDEKTEESKSTKVFECGLCYARVLSLKELHEHFKTHSKKRLECKVCKLFMYSFAEFNKHQAYHWEEGNIVKCPMCEDCLDNDSTLFSHMKEVHLCIYDCKFCQEQFETIIEKEKHEKQHSEALKYSCNKCGERFSHPRVLRRHVATCLRESKCRICGKEIKSMKALHLHENRHRYKKIFPCSSCDKIFKTRSGLIDHQALHTGVYRFNCNICGHGYQSKRLYKEHINTHEDNPKPLYTCDICGKQFLHLSSLVPHRKLHEKPFHYVCEFCGKNIHFASHVKVHLRLHTGERPYKCLYCSKTFTNGSTLRIHTMTHTGLYAYKCLDCNKGYAARKIYLKHRNKVHGDELGIDNCRDCDVDFFSRKMFYIHRHRVHGEPLPEKVATVKITVGGNDSSTPKYASKPTLKNKIEINVKNTEKSPRKSKKPIKIAHPKPNSLNISEELLPYNTDHITVVEVSEEVEITTEDVVVQAVASIVEPW